MSDRKLKDLRFYPTVFAVKNDYQIFVTTHGETIVSVKVNGKLYHDEIAGVMRSKVPVHIVSVPQCELNKAKEYTVIYRRVLKRNYYGVDLDEPVEISFNFKPIESDKINVYLSEYGAEAIKKLSCGNEPYMDSVNIRSLKFYETYDVDKYKFTPLKGHHHTGVEANSANYIIDFPDGRKMYYALDSGPYLEETFEYLKNVKLDILVSECTFPVEEMGIDVHMGLTEVRKTLDRLFEQGTINENTKIYMTHICCMGMNHSQLVKYWEDTAPMYDITVAYDGMSMEDV